MKLFRNIRLQLLGHNNTPKYLRYAIGEILLVVLGILIALQINNWNQNVNNQNYATLLLKEIYYDLADDYTIIYVGVEPRLERKIISVNRIKEMMTDVTVPSDSVFMRYYEGMKQGFFLSQRTGAFESLKLGGLEKIENDSLRTELLEFYESDIPRSLKFIYGFDDQIQSRVKDLEAELFEYKFMSIQNGEKIHIKLPKNANYINDQALHEIYAMLNRDAYEKKSRLRYLKNNYNKLMAMIEKELERNEVDFKVLDTTALKRDFSN